MVKSFLIVAGIVQMFLLTSYSLPTEPSLSADEQELLALLREYRSAHKLPAIPLSAKLQKVAQLHAFDLETNQPVKGKCNLHSWSNKGDWTPCCYTGDAASARCMWQKPKEIAQYQGSGYEIAAFATNMSPKVAFEGWKGSKYHNEVMVNKGDWASMNWKAVGVGMSGKYAVIWFGAESD